MTGLIIFGFRSWLKAQGYDIKLNKVRDAFFHDRARLYSESRYLRHPDSCRH